MTHVHSFPPVARASANVLILGSMPGKKSLQESRYYAHPMNLFWPFMQELLSVPLAASYKKRCDALKDKNVALWDSLKTCTRSGSLDADIEASSIVPNDFATFFRQHPHIDLVCFNGATSQKVFLRHVLPELGTMLDGVKLVRLPSTSPANASIPRDVKLRDWRIIAR